MSEYTPTTEQARYAYTHSVMVSDPEMRREMEAAFDRWLSHVKAEAKAEALQEASGSITLPDWDSERDAEIWLYNRADGIRGGVQS